MDLKEKRKEDGTQILDTRNENVIICRNYTIT